MIWGENPTCLFQAKPVEGLPGPFDVDDEKGRWKVEDDTNMPAFHKHRTPLSL